MAKKLKELTTSSKLVMSKTGSGWHFLIFPGKTIDKMDFVDRYRRVLCSINGGEKFHCALMPDGTQFYIIVNKKRRDELGIIAGDTVDVVLTKDESEYGLPMLDEFREVLDQDPEGDRLFHALTKGSQRSALYWLSRTKDTDRRIQEALIFLEHLKANDGKIDGRKLTAEIKAKTTHPRTRADDLWE